MFFLSLRRRLHFILHRSRGRGGRMMNAFIALLIILSVSTTPIYFFPQLSFWIPWFWWFEVLVVIFFAVEYILRIWTARSALRYVFSWSGLIDMGVVIPFLLYANGLIGVGLFAGLRFIRLLKLGNLYSVERDVISREARTVHGDFITLQNEVIQRVVHRHPIVYAMNLVPLLLFTSMGIFIILFFPTSFLAIGMGVLFLIASFLFMVKLWLDFQYDVIYITNNRIIFQNREIFGSKTNDISYEAITNIRPDSTGFLHFLFGFGNIDIETASVENEHFEDIIDPHGVVYDISQNRQKILDRDNITIGASPNASS